MILHFTLRVSDKLFEFLIDILNMIDGNNLTRNIDERPMIKIFNDFIEIECNVTHPFYIKQVNNTSSLEMRILNQNERMRILDKMYEQYRDQNERLLRKS